MRTPRSQPRHPLPSTRPEALGRSAIVGRARRLGSGLALFAIGCGGAQPAAGTKAALDPEAELAEAERELSALLERAPKRTEEASGYAAAPAGADAPAQPAPPVAPSPSPQPAAEAANELEPASKAEPSAARDACSAACDAGSAIARAVERICELDGPQGARCERAKSRLDDARARLARQCPSCSP